MRMLYVFLIAVLTLPAHAAIQSKAVKYDYDGEKLTGYLYWDDVMTEKRPGVLVIHEWWGLNDYAKERARMLAELGYVAFAADIYGGGRVTDKPEQGTEWMQEVTADVEGWRERAELGSGAADGQRYGRPGPGGRDRLLLRRRHRAADGVRGHQGQGRGELSRLAPGRNRRGARARSMPGCWPSMAMQTPS